MIVQHSRKEREIRREREIEKKAIEETRYGGSEREGKDRTREK